MDTGLADILGNPEQITPPALVIFDLKTDKLIRRFEFAAEDAKEDTFFANVVGWKKKLKLLKCIFKLYFELFD